MKYTKRNLYYIPGTDIRDFSKENLMAHNDKMYDIFYDGEVVSMNNKWSGKTISFTKIEPGNLIIIKVHDNRAPEIELFTPPSTINPRYPLWAYLTWPRTRITDNEKKYEEVFALKRKEAPVYEIREDKVKLFYLVSYDDNYNLDSNKILKGYCYLSPEATNIDTAEVVMTLLSKGIKGHEWIISVLGYPDKRYDLIANEIKPYDDCITIEDKMQWLKEYILKYK